MWFSATGPIVPGKYCRRILGQVLLGLLGDALAAADHYCASPSRIGVTPLARTTKFSTTRVRV